VWHVPAVNAGEKESCKVPVSVEGLDEKELHGFVFFSLPNREDHNSGLKGSSPLNL